MKAIFHALISPYVLWCFLTCCALGKEANQQNLLENAKKIDDIITAQLADLNIERPIIASDETFLRRAFLTTIGRIPTPDETYKFKDLGSAEARQDLILHLYKQPGYLSHMSNWVMDLLRLKDKNQRGYNAKALVHWVRDSIAEDKPWNQFAQELVSSKGNAWVDSGAAGFYTMDMGMQNDNLANTAFAFLGVKMECAQCHDDPFQEWERMDFYQLSALVNGGTNLGFKSGMNFRELSSKNPEEYEVKKFGRIDQLEQMIRYFILFGTPDDKGMGVVNLPKDWQYDDGKPDEMVKAKTPFGQRYKSDVKLMDEIELDLSHAQALTDKKEKREAMAKAKDKYKEEKAKARKGSGDGLEVFADWLTSEETPQFSQTVALRMWERVMGFSLTESLGHYQDAEDTNFPELISFLSELMRSYNYDLKSFQTTLALTNAFQAKGTAEDFLNADPHNLGGRRVNRMSAAQIWDSLLALVVANPDELPKNKLPENIIYRGYNLGPIKETVIKCLEMSKSEYQEYVKKTYRDLVAGKFPKAQQGGGSDASMMGMEMSMEGMNKNVLAGAKNDYKQISSKLRRASEMSSPIKKDHFLSTFGQSGRQTIDESTTEGTVSQALLMYNGTVQRNIVNNKASALRLKLNSIPTPKEKIKTIFITTLNREPTEQELEVCLAELKTHGPKVYLDILSSLISSQEFLFIT